MLNRTLGAYTIATSNKDGMINRSSHPTKTINIRTEERLRVSDVIYYKINKNPHQSKGLCAVLLIETYYGCLEFATSFWCALSDALYGKSGGDWLWGGAGNAALVGCDGKCTLAVYFGNFTRFSGHSNDCTWDVAIDDNYNSLSTTIAKGNS